MGLVKLFTNFTHLSVSFYEQFCTLVFYRSHIEVSRADSHLNLKRRSGFYLEVPLRNAGYPARRSLATKFVARCFVTAKFVVLYIIYTDRDDISRSINGEVCGLLLYTEWTCFLSICISGKISTHV